LKKINSCSWTYEIHTQYNIAVKWFLELDEEPLDFTAMSEFRAKFGVRLYTELFMGISRQINKAGSPELEEKLYFSFFHFFIYH